MLESKINGNRTDAMHGVSAIPDILQIRPTQSTGRKVLLSIVPLTPTPITGPDAWIGWGRIVTYGTLAAMTHNKARKLSYFLMGATTLSLVTSLAGEAYTPPNGAQ